MLAQLHFELKTRRRSTSKRVFKCASCRTCLDRDENASQMLAQRTLGIKSRDKFELMALLAEDEAAYSMLAMKLQRDINCLADPERGVRRRAMDKLSRALQAEAAGVSPAVLAKLCADNLQRALLTSAGQDTVEKCREKALTLLLFLAEKRALALSAQVLAELVALASSRLGKLPYPEHTEEIRLLLLQLVALYLKQLAGESEKVALRDVMADVANVLGKAALDPFPDVKKVVADCVIVIGNVWPRDLALQLGAVVRPLVTSLGHQHSRVRVCALQALEAAVPCVSEALPELMKETLLPALGKALFDHAPSVRKQLALTLASWFQRIETIHQYETALLPLLLSGVVDESPEVREVTLTKLDELALKWEREDESGAESVAMEVDSEQSLTPPALYSARPPRGARVLAARVKADVIPILLERTGDWTVHVREHYTKILSAYLILLEQDMNPFLDKVFAALGKICRDDEDAVVRAVTQCSGVIGFYADSQMVLASLLPMVAGRLAGQDTAQHRTNGLILLGMSIDGMTAKTIAPHLDLITEALCDPGVRESEVADLQVQLATVASSIIHTAGDALPKLSEVSFRLFWVLNHLLAASGEASAAHETATEALGSLAVTRNLSVEDLYRQFLGKLLGTMALPKDAATCWKKSEPSRMLFDALCRRGGTACGDNMDVIVPVILVHLDPARDADVRLSFLALLETMLGTDAVCKAFQPFSTSLLLKGIVPNIVWQGGRVAATIRKVAVACAYTLLRQGLTDQVCLFEVAPQMLPVLKSSMDDGDAKTRHLICLALQYLFVALPGCLGEEPVHQLYSEILKRLDDSNDTVRKAACQTFITFLQAAPKEHFRGTIIDYSLDCLFVHLDDSDPDIQVAVLAVLKQAIAVDSALVAKKAQENRSRHQNPKYCDELLVLANQAAA